MFISRVLLIVLLGACATIDPNSRPPDWPVLTRRTVIVNTEEELKRVCDDAHPGYRVEGCAVINFKLKTCTINLAKRRGEAPWTIKEENDHCDGKDHPGGTALRRAWEWWKLLEKLKLAK